MRLTFALGALAVALCLLAPPSWATTALVKDIRPGSAGSSPFGLTNVNGTLLFGADDGSHGSELWKSDGAAAGTTLVKDINPGSGGSFPYGFSDLNGTSLFGVDDGSHGVELWKTNGTAAGTMLVKDINPGSASSSPAVNGGTTTVSPEITNVNGELFFIADDGSHGEELWKSDGTAAGTRLVKDIKRGSGGSFPRALTTLNGKLFFNADDGSHGFELWKSDGTAAGTTLVKDIKPGSAGGVVPNELINVNGTLFLSAAEGSHGFELWKSDGSAAGTKLVKDINPGKRSSFPGHFTNVSGKLFFDADDGSHGDELWKSDGTAAGTALVSDINRGSVGSAPFGLTNINGTLFFGADDSCHGTELWRSDGSAAVGAASKPQCDNSPPTIRIQTPAGGAHYKRRQNVRANYSCSDPDGRSDVASCQGPVASGQPIDTRSTGQHAFTVHATDKAGNSAMKTVHYTVTKQRKHRCLGDQDVSPSGRCINMGNDGEKRSVARAR